MAPSKFFRLALIISFFLVNMCSVANAVMDGKFNGVRSIDMVCVSINKSNPPQLSVHAKGTVPTSGWKNGMLTPYFYVTPPKDGMQEFSFIAEAPTGMVLMVISTIEGDGAVIYRKKWMKGARVYASDGSSKEAKLSDPKCGKMETRGE